MAHDRDYESPELIILGTVAELTQAPPNNPKVGFIMDGNNMQGLGKTSVWPG